MAINVNFGVPITTPTAINVDGGYVNATTGTFSNNVTTSGSYIGNLNKNLALKIDNGSTEGTNLYTFNNSNNKELNIKSGSNVTLTTSANTLVINSTDTVYTHPDSGVTAGTYSYVTVNAQGHITSGISGAIIADGNISNWD